MHPVLFGCPPGINRPVKDKRHVSSRPVLRICGVFTVRDHWASRRSGFGRCCFGDLEAIAMDALIGATGSVITANGLWRLGFQRPFIAAIISAVVLPGLHQFVRSKHLTG